jgi:hypothetical protein
MTTTTSEQAKTALRQAVLGHLALHFMPGDEHQARRLLELLGCTLVDNGPSPGSDGFCSVLVNGSNANYADNIMFLSPATPVQVAVESAIRETLHIGEPGENPATSTYCETMTTNPESLSHIGLRFQNLEELEQVLADIEVAAAPGGELEGRIQLVKYPARPGDDAAASATVAQRIAASPAFSGNEAQSFAPYWIQCFVTTDLCGFGILALGNTFELDYVFDPFFEEPPTFGRRRSKGETV